MQVWCFGHDVAELEKLGCSYHKSDLMVLRPLGLACGRNVEEFGMWAGEAKVNIGLKANSAQRHWVCSSFLEMSAHSLTNSSFQDILMVAGSQLCWGCLHHRNSKPQDLSIRS